MRWSRKPEALWVAVGVGSLSAALTLLLLDAPANAGQTKRLLVVTVTKGFRHSDSIPLAEKVVADLGAKGGWTVDYVRTDEEMAQKMNPAALQQYNGVLFASTTGDLPLPDREAFLRWIAAGNAFIGIHAAADTFHGYGPYLDMVGGEFKTHGAQSEVLCLVEDTRHPATKMLGTSFKVFDEIYQFQRYDRSRFRSLISLDKHPNDGTPGYYPIAWCRMHGKGRVFYTALGHRPDVWDSNWFQLHLRGGIRWALGLEKGSAAPNPPK